MLLWRNTTLIFWTSKRSSPFLFLLLAILPEENVVLFGLGWRVVDPPEVEFLRNSSIEQFSVKTILEIGVEAAEGKPLGHYHPGRNSRSFTSMLMSSIQTKCQLWIYLTNLA
jgi:hypothetical protein